MVLNVCSVPSLVANRITRITHWSVIVEMVRFLHLCETNLKKDVIDHQQMKAMGVTLAVLTLRLLNFGDCLSDDVTK